MRAFTIECQSSGTSSGCRDPLRHLSVKKDLEKFFSGESDGSARCVASFCRRMTGLGALESPINADSPNIETVEIGQSFLCILGNWCYEKF